MGYCNDVKFRPEWIVIARVYWYAILTNGVLFSSNPALNNVHFVLVFWVTTCFHEMQPDRAWLVPNSLPCQGPFSTRASATRLKCRQTDRHRQRARERESERAWMTKVGNKLREQLHGRSAHRSLAPWAFG
jgi:hypothetical protein